MVNPEEDLGSFWEQYNGQPVQQPQVNDLVYRNELEGIPPEQLENNRPYYYTPEDQKSSEGALKLLQLAANTQPQTANDAGPQWDIDRAKQGITNIESGGNYLAQGPLVKYKDGTEDRAYGKYQVMGRNIPVWTKQVLGVALTPEQFLQSKEAQEKVFEHKFGENVKRYGNVADAASVWFAGKPIAQAGNRSDVLGTTVPNYVAKFLSAYNGAPQRETPVEGGSNARGSVAATMETQPDQKTLADVKAAVTKSRAPDFAAIVKALAAQGGGSPMINQAMQANQQQAMAARRKMASEVAKFDEERVASLAEALKRGTVKGYASGGKAIQYFEEGGEADSGNDNGSNNDSVGTNSDVSGKGQESGPGIGDNDSFGGMADVASQNANEASLSNSSFGFSGTASPTSNVGTALGNTDFGAFGTNLSGVTATDFSGTTASPFGGVATDPSATPGYGGMSTANVGSLATGDVGAVGTAFGGGPASPSNNTDTDTDKSDSISNPTMADVNAIESLAKELASLNQSYGADSSSNELYKTKFADGGEVMTPNEPDVGLSIEDWERGPTVNGKVVRPEHPFAPVFNLENWKKLPELSAEDWKNKLYAMAQHYGEGAVNMFTAPKKVWTGEISPESPEAQRAAAWLSNLPLSSVPLAAGKPAAGTLFSGGIEPKGNVNLRPMVSADVIKGPEVQTLDSMLSQIRGMPGVTKEGFDALVQKYQGMEPNARISKTEFEKSIPASEYSKIDLIKEADKYNQQQKILQQQADDYLKNEGKEKFNNQFVQNLNTRYPIPENLNTESLFKFINGTPLSKVPDVKDFVKDVYDQTYSKYYTGKLSKLYNPSEEDIRSFFKGQYDFDYNQTIRELKSELAAKQGIYNPVEHTNAYELDQRLVQPGRGKAEYTRDARDPNYFVLGVTHPSQTKSYADYNKHFNYLNPNEHNNMIASVRGQILPEGGELIISRGAKGYEYNKTVKAKPNSAVIEEIQSDVAKNEKDRPDLHQIHATGFKTGIQHALENGATTVYLPTSKTVGLMRPMSEPSSFAPIYDQEIIKYGLKPLLKIDGVTSKLIGKNGYHEINFTPEAIEAILKGKGQRTPGYADGGLVTDNGQTPDGTGGQQYDAYGNLTEAQGGPIHAIEYNPDHINAIAQQIQEGTYA